MKNRDGNRKSRFSFDKEDWKGVLSIIFVFLFMISCFVIGIRFHDKALIITSIIGIIPLTILLLLVFYAFYESLSKAEKVKIKYEKQQYKEKLSHKLDYMSVYKEVISELESKGRFKSCILALNPTYEKWMEETDFNKLINKLQKDGFNAWSYKRDDYCCLGDYYCFEVRFKED